jgi:NitT/TauT family transport system permease protein
VNTALKGIATTLFVLFVWQVSCAVFEIPRYIFPKPTEVLVFAGANATALLTDAAFTGLESLAGFCIGIAVSLSAAIFVHFVQRSERFFAVTTIGAQSIPILAIAPFLTSWFGSGIGSKIAASAVVCVFPLIGGWMSGKNSINANEQIFAESVLPTPWKRLWHFILPRSLPAFVAALKVACPLSVLGALVGEFVGAQRGLGFRILTGSYYLRTEEMVCGVVLACALSLMLYISVLLVERTWLFWYGVNAK